MNNTAHDQLSEHVSALEAHMCVLNDALARGAFEAIELASSALQRALLNAAQAFATHTRAGIDIDADLRRRLLMAREGAKVQAQAVQRVSASLGRTLDVLLPRDVGTAAVTYGALSSSPGAKSLSAYR